MEDTLGDEAASQVLILAPLHEVHGQALLEVWRYSEKNDLFSNDLREPSVIDLALGDTMNLACVHDVSGHVLANEDLQLVGNVLGCSVTAAFEERDDEILLLCGEVLVNALAELSELHLGGLPYTA